MAGLAIALCLVYVGISLRAPHRHPAPPHGLDRLQGPRRQAWIAYLLRTHGGAYAEYAARVGRFVPGVGRLGSRRAPG